MSSNNNDKNKQALLSLVQEDTNGHSLSTSYPTSWSSNTNVPVCNWEGIICGGNEDIKEVSLPAKGLSGTIPTELGILSELEILNLSKNMLQGSIPQEIANLPKLTTLDLSETFITGTLPQYFASTQLSTLLLANNAISGKFFMKENAPHLSSIKEIRMENNLLTGTLDGSTLTFMSHLETLSLSDNDLSGLIPGEELGSLPTLHYLYLDGNHFIGPLPSQLAQVGKASLLELWVQDNALSGTVPASYVRFDKIHDFYIDGNKLTGELPPDLCGPEINADFFTNVPPEAERNYCDGIACPAGSVAFEGVFPCEKCPGGEAARLKNRYLGQTGECSNYTQRDILQIFHKATTKGGPWRGVSDWNDENKPVCEMTGVTCDAYDHVVEISLKNRGLEGHIPDEIGSLTFLESLDVSDNKLMGYVPSDLQWTSITRLDISGNKIRGMVPPLLCMMEELNGNGEENVFYCDRIACPEGTFNDYGFHHGLHGEVCQPCYDEVPFIGQKTCRNTKSKFGWKDTVQMAEDASEQIGISPMLGLGILLAVSLVLLLTCWIVKNAYFNPRKKYEMGTTNEYDVDSPTSYKDDKAYRYNDEENEDDDVKDDYSFAESNIQSRYKDSLPVYKGKSNFSITSDDEYHDDEDDNMSRSTTRSATDLMNDHRGVALNRREKFKKAVSGRMSSGDLGRRAREAASSINVSVKSQRLRRHSSIRTPGSNYSYDQDDDMSRLTTRTSGSRDEDIDIPASLELTQTHSSTSRDDKSLRSSHGEMLDVPMIC